MPLHNKRGCKRHSKILDDRRRQAGQQIILLSSYMCMHQAITTALIRADLRGGSVRGRIKRLPRESCRWFRQYFSENRIYGDKAFRDVFGVPKSVYIILCEQLSPYIVCPVDAIGRPGMSVELRILCTFRLLRTGMACVQLDDQIGFSTETIRLCYRQILSLIVRHLREKYIPLMPKTDIVRELKLNEARGLPGCVGSIDCFHVARHVRKSVQGVNKQGIIDAYQEYPFLATSLLVCGV